MRCLPLLLLALAFNLPVEAWWTGKTYDQMISFDDDEYARGVQIIYTQTDMLHILWAEDAPSVRELHYGNSADWGDTWSSSAFDRVISFPDGQDVYEECSVVEGLDGTLIAVWSEMDAGAREVHYGVSHDDGATWSCTVADLILSDPASAVNTQVPSIACDHTGAFHVVWGQAAASGDAEVHYARSNDGGATWSSTSVDRAISFADGNSVVNPKVMAYGDRLIVIWRELGATGLPCMHGGFSADGGLTWNCETADHEISPTATLIADHGAGAGPYGSNGAHVAYKATYNTSSPYYYEIYVTSSFDGGDTWTGESGVTLASHDEGAGRSASNPDVCVNADLMPIVAWDEEDDLAGTKELHVSFLNGTQWTGAQADSVISFPDGENGYRPSIASPQWVWMPARDRDYPQYWVVWTVFAGGTNDNYEVHLSTLFASLGAVAPGADEALALRAIPSPSAAGVRLEFSMPAAGPATVEIFDAEGRLLRTLSDRLAAGRVGLHWDGRDGRGGVVQHGRYLARLRTAEGLRTLGLVRL